MPTACAAGSRGGWKQQRRGLAGRGSQQQQQPARTCVQWVPVPSIGQLCQAAEGRGTQCLARPPGGTGSSGAQGPWSEYTAKPQLAAPKGGYGPARPSGRWACPPGGCSYAGGCPVSSGGLAWRGRKRRSSVFAPTSNLQAAPSTPSAADIPHSTAPTSTARKEPDESNRRSTRPTMSADAHGRNRRAQLISTHPPTQLSV